MKIIVNMLSKADSVDGQGVGSAYIEQVNLIKEELKDTFEVRINSRKKADIVHVHSVNPGFYFRFKKKNGVRVMYCHFLPETLKGSIKLPKPIFAIFCKYVMSFYKKAEYLVVVNPIFKQDLIKLGVKEERIIYIPNYVSKDSFYPISKEQCLEVRKKYNISENKFVVLGCGQVQTRKGVLDFVEVAKNNPEIEFVWCGGFSFKGITDGYSELKKIVDNPPCENLKFLGIIPRTEMNLMFNMADCLFMPSYNELFPMSILEAASASKPIVLRDLDLYKDILWDNYLKGNDNDQFSKLICKLAEDLEFYKHCCQLSNQISTYYSKENVAKLWKDFYLEIYDKRNSKKK
ncbi:MAG: glycosyltransferase family 4 protein [Anaeroplasmataceae bacterium]|nr:glycosyltransferase family 4 protein [Anaeroplasmataceae bacterium]